MHLPTPKSLNLPVSEPIYSMPPCCMAPGSVLHVTVCVNSTFWNTFQQQGLLSVSTFSEWIFSNQFAFWHRFLLGALLRTTSDFYTTNLFYSILSPYLTHPSYPNFPSLAALSVPFPKASFSASMHQMAFDHIPALSLTS